MRQIVVTGAGTGIGYAIAEHFAASGDAVTITGRRAEVLHRAADTLGARAVPFDATDPDAVEAALDSLPDHVDVVVNNAGANTDFERPEPDGLRALARQWEANLASNVLSAVLVTAALTPRLTDGARVVTIGSIAARQGAGSYGAAKAAVEAWTADLAGQLGPRGITANVVAPGLTEHTGFFQNGLPEQRRDELVAATRNQRAGTPADIAALTGFLASPQAGHITGQVLHVNGGAYLGH
ncbi:SDR family oxidoreductase [Saccharopolyspora erythraea]|uniref:SDR family NAD(P)-dependent oxidoreductase n=1 Tax=Saccharopolyspora erythraea TaxID=1836 RepID=UPI001BA8BA3B|nr:SDR family NAD(P)-dependent oxidoreductase [Saccharopolyspora erythraea]QUH02878.1 SDR family oxidoreductase [Saccharopolyspora erythraea]